MSVLRTMEDAVSLPLVSTYLTASTVPVMLDTPVMVLSAQVRYYFVGYRLLYFTIIAGLFKEIFRTPQRRSRCEGSRAGMEFLGRGSHSQPPPHQLRGLGSVVSSSEV